jgi:membrane protease subunit HflC
MRTLGVIAIVLLLGLLIWSICVQVDETEFVVITLFGNPNRVIVKPGLQFKWPAPIETALRFDNRLLVYEHPNPERREKEYLTRDKKNVIVSTYTCWRITPNPESVLKFLETVGSRQNAETRIGDIVVAELGSVLGSYDFDALISSEQEKRHWAEITKTIRDTCRDRVAASFGIDLVDFQIQRLNFPEQNRQSVFSRMRAERERIATQYRSEGDEEAMKIRAAAQRQQEEILAEAFKTAEQIKGKADAEATHIYAEAYSQDPEFYRFLRTLESYEKALTEGTVAILSGDSELLHLLNEPAQPEKEEKEK